MLDRLMTTMWNGWYGPFAVLIVLVMLTTFGLLMVISIERAGPHTFVWWLKYFAYHLMLLGGVVAVVLMLLHIRTLMGH